MQDFVVFHIEIKLKMRGRMLRICTGISIDELAISTECTKLRSLFPTIKEQRFHSSTLLFGFLGFLERDLALQSGQIGAFR